MKIKSVEKIKDVPWRYTLYRINSETFVISVYYQPISVADSSISIELTKEEAGNIENEEWLLNFSNNVQQNYQSYFRRAIDYNACQSFK